LGDATIFDKVVRGRFAPLERITHGSSSSLLFFARHGRLLHPLALAPHSASPLQVIAKYRVGLHAVLQAPQLQFQFGGRLFREAVNHPFFVPPRGHEAAGPQVGEMLGNCYLRQPQNVLDMTDTERALGQEVQDAKASLVAKAPVDLRQFHIPHQSYTSDGI
jgi:hypothetical protein